MDVYYKENPIIYTNKGIGVRKGEEYDWLE